MKSFKTSTLLFFLVSLASTQSLADSLVLKNDCEASDGTCLSPEEFKEISENPANSVVISVFVSFARYIDKSTASELAALKIKQTRLQAKENL
jgi:hypothetical protein